MYTTQSLDKTTQNSSVNIKGQPSGILVEE